MTLWLALILAPSFAVLVLGLLRIAWLEREARRMGRALTREAHFWSGCPSCFVSGDSPRPVDTDMAEWVPEEDRTETT